MAAPICSVCAVERAPVFSEPVTLKWEIRSYRCPICKTVLRLVEPSEQIPRRRGKLPPRPIE